eukprot:TRINITY_DN32897_c0_g1_i1.p1 TRINITY_DN32897_c0_g1~~TRINITY_DN32897_c0_g1_i1.p1  ORF type:complete len:101 (-),score=17.88 TRINITY_DN32897_c0_g1_i1:303-605(-)
MCIRDSLSPFHNMTSIPPHFLHECTGLTTIDLTPLSGVSVISNVGMPHGVPANDGHFLLGCTGITHLDMSPMVLLSKEEKQHAVTDYLGKVSFDGNVTWE